MNVLVQSSRVASARWEPRTPAYAGFVKRGWRNTIPYVEPFPNMQTPIVPLRSFVIVAQHGREAGADWVRHLAEYLD
ncbi:MAG: hypothetical protein JW934_08085 [Anaerolineae bacterium]|nr:hypothetical protein [Anaerolineae bacterium]